LAQYPLRLTLCRFAYAASTLSVDVPQRDDLYLEDTLRDAIPSQWGFTAESYFRIRSLSQDQWTELSKCLPEWLDEVGKDWCDRGILWKYQFIKIALETLLEKQRKIFDEIEEFESRLAQRRGRRLRYYRDSVVALEFQLSVVDRVN
jgi:hypothetical protein